MIKVYLDDWAEGEEDFQNEIDMYKDEVTNHAFTVDVPAPMPKHTLIKSCSINEYEFISKTRKQEILDILQAEQDAVETEKLAAQTTPSENYAEFRKQEYPPMGDGCDALVKWVNQAILEDIEPHPSVASYVEKCNEVKAKFPKPDRLYL